MCLQTVPWIQQAARGLFFFFSSHGFIQLIPDSSGGYPDEPTATIGNQDVLIQHSAYIVYRYIYICMVSVKSETLLPYSFAGAMGIHWFLLEAQKRLSRVLSTFTML